jgi:hypothetical protein
MVDRTRSARWFWILYGFLAVVCALWGAGKIARSQIQIARDVVGRLRAGFGEPGGIDVSAVALEEWGQAVAPLILFALAWLIAHAVGPESARVSPQ